MQYRALGKTGIEVSCIGIGAWQLGGPLTLDGRPDGHPDPGEEKVIHLIRELGERGVKLIDTAEQYGGGRSEERVGKAIAQKRAHWVLSTKFGARVGPSGERINDASPQTIRSSLEGSLRRMKTDYVDIYLYHVPPKRDWIEEGREILDALKAEGKIRCYGISTNNIHVLRLMAESDAAEVIQYSQSLLTHQPELLTLQSEHGWGGMVRGAFAGGRLSGRYFDRAPDFHADDSRSQWLSAQDFAACKAFDELRPEGWSMPMFALRYLLDAQQTHTILLGTRRLQDYLDVLDVGERAQLKEGLVERISELRKKIRDSDQVR